MTPDLSAYRRHVEAQGYAATTRRLLLGVVADIARSSDVAPSALTVEDVERFLGRDLAPATRRGYLWALRKYVEWAEVDDPTAKMRRPRIPEAVPRPVSEQDLAALLAAANPRQRAYILLGAYCGLRSFETAKVAVEDIERRVSGTVLRVQGKGGRVDLLPLPAIVEADLRPWRVAAGAGRLWPGATAGSVQTAIRRVGDRIGVPVTSHQLRHRYGTALYLASRDLLATQRLMRHASPKTTAGYALVADEVGRSLVDRLPVPRLQVAG